MTHLTSDALRDDPTGLAFLKAVLRPAAKLDAPPSPKAVPVPDRLSPSTAAVVTTASNTEPGAAWRRTA